MEHITTLHEQDVQFSNVQPGGHFTTTEL